MLLAAMAATRFNHFGSSFALPDASYAVFLLGGMYLSRYAGFSLAAFVTLLTAAGSIDWYATAAGGVSDWCMSPAYWFLIPTYAWIWLAGQWYGNKYTLTSNNTVNWLGGLLLISLVTSSFAFFLSNATFFILSGRYDDMDMFEYGARVAGYYLPYLSITALYVGCTGALQITLKHISTWNHGQKATSK